MLLLLGPLGRLVARAVGRRCFRYIEPVSPHGGLRPRHRRHPPRRLSPVARRRRRSSPPRARSPSAAPRRCAAARSSRSALLALIVVGVNCLAARHYARGDWTRGHTFALSDKTTAARPRPPRDVDVIVFMMPAGEDANDLYGDVHELLERARRLSPRLHVEYVDIDREPERAQDRRQEVRRLRRRPRRRRHRRRLRRRSRSSSPAPSSPTTTTPPRERAARRRMKAWKGEQALAPALLAVTDERAPDVCFITGHGEPAIDGFDPDAYGDFAEELRRDHQAPRAITSTAASPPTATSPCWPAPSAAAQARRRRARSPSSSAAGASWCSSARTFDAKVTRFVDVGVEDLLDRWGASPRNDIVVDEPRLRGSAVAFAVTRGLRRPSDHRAPHAPPDPVVDGARGPRRAEARPRRARDRPHQRRRLGRDRPRHLPRRRPSCASTRQGRQGPGLHRRRRRAHRRHRQGRAPGRLRLLRDRLATACSSRLQPRPPALGGLVAARRARRASPSARARPSTCASRSTTRSSRASCLLRWSRCRCFVLLLGAGVFWVRRS